MNMIELKSLLVTIKKIVSKGAGLSGLLGVQWAKGKRD